MHSYVYDELYLTYLVRYPGKHYVIYIRVNDFYIVVSYPTAKILN